MSFYVSVSTKCLQKTVKSRVRYY